MIISKTSSKNQLPIYIGTAALGALLSIYATMSTDVINNDGILYIYTAEAFLQGGFTQAMTVFSWPFFSIIIAWFHTLTGVSLQISAYIVNSIFLIIASIAFIRIYEEISTHSVSLWVPALIILSLPILNEYRSYIIRGHGAWAFILIALLYFIRYTKRPTIRSAILWQIFAVTSTLFRIEGVVFLACAPFYFAFLKNERKFFFRHFIRLNSILIPTSIVSIIILFSYILKMDGLSSSLQLYLNYMLPNSIIISIKNAALGMEAIMTNVSSNEAILITAAGLISLIAFKVIKNITLFYLVIWTYGYHNKWINLRKDSYIVLFFAATSLLPLIAITGNQLFISSRYTVLTIILLSLIYGQYIQHLFYKLIANKRIRAISGLLFLVALFFLDAIIHTGAIKGNIKTASQWTIQHIEPTSMIACNNKRFQFYTNQRCIYKRYLDNKNFNDIRGLHKKSRYSHMLLWIDHDNQRMKAYIEDNNALVLLKSFNNIKGDEANIYAIRQ